MIEFIRGICKAKEGSTIIVDVSGVGYGVDVPLTTMLSCGAVGQDIELWIETYVREDAIKLFGFLHNEDKKVFRILRSISGVGPKIALAILSQLTGKQVQMAALQGRKELFESVSGVGKRLAERLIIELKPKFEKWQSSKTMSIKSGGSASAADFDEFSEGLEESQTWFDLSDALGQLGFKDKDIQIAVSKLKSSPARPEDFSALLKLALMDLRA